MRYDVHLQSHSRSWPKLYLCKKNEIQWKQVIVQTPCINDLAPRFIKKSVKNWEKYKYWNSANPETYTLCPHKVSLNVKFEGSSWKTEGRMLIFNLIQDLHPSDAYTEKNWNPMKRTKVIIRTSRVDGRTEGQTGWIQYTPLNFVAGGIKTSREISIKML